MFLCIKKIQYKIFSNVCFFDEIENVYCAMYVAFPWDAKLLAFPQNLLKKGNILNYFYFNFN